MNPVLPPFATGLRDINLNLSPADHYSSNSKPYVPSLQVAALMEEVYRTDPTYISELQILKSYTDSQSDLFSLVDKLINLHQTPSYLATPDSRKGWAIKADGLYSSYIKLYKYNPDDLPQLIHIFKRPLARIKLMSTFFKVSQ